MRGGGFPSTTSPKELAMIRKRKIGDLWKYAENTLGISQEEARRILNVNGLSGTFDPSLWNSYTSTLSRHKELASQILEKVSADERILIVDKCPVCGADVTPHPWSNGMYGVANGWRCTSGEPHFTQWGMRRRYASVS